MKKIILFICLVFILTGCNNTDVSTDKPQKSQLIVAAAKDKTGAMTQLIKSFENEHQNISVRLIELPQRSEDCHRAMVSLLSGNEADVDIILIEDAWIKEFVSRGYIRNIENISVNDSFDGIKNNILINGNVYSLPLEIDVGLIYYRKDQVDGTQTWLDIRNSNNITYSIENKYGDDMIFNLLELINCCDDIQSGINLYKDLLEKQIKKDEDCLTLFKNGTINYIRGWASDSKSIKNEFPNIRGKVGTKILINNKKCFSYGKFYSFAINNNVINVDASKEFLDFCNNDSNIISYLKERGTMPAKLKLLENPIILDYTDYAGKMLEQIDELKFRNCDENYMQNSKKAYESLRAYLNRDTTINEVTEKAKKIIDDKGKL